MAVSSELQCNNRSNERERMIECNAWRHDDVAVGLAKLCPATCHISATRTQTNCNAMAVVHQLASLQSQPALQNGHHHLSNPSFFILINSQ